MSGPLPEWCAGNSLGTASYHPTTPIKSDVLSNAPMNPRTAENSTHATPTPTPEPRFAQATKSSATCFQPDARASKKKRTKRSQNKPLAPKQTRFRLGNEPTKHPETNQTNPSERRWHASINQTARRFKCARNVRQVDAEPCPPAGATHQVPHLRSSAFICG